MKIAHTIDEACEASRFGRSTICDAIKAGNLVAKKHGRRVLILDSDLRRWLEGLPAVAPSELTAA